MSNERAQYTDSNGDEETQPSWRSVLSKPHDLGGFRPFSSHVEVEIGAATHGGTVLRYNSDHFLAIRVSRSQETLLTSLAACDLPPRFEEHAYAMAVADGLGDSGAGALASRLALSAVAHLVIEYGRWNVRIGPETASDIAEQADFYYRQAHQAIVNASRADTRLASMATSMTALYIAGRDLFFAHVGHSKAFVFRDGTLTQLTADHTLKGERKATPRTTQWDRLRVDVDHVVTESLGGSPTGPNVEVEHVQLWSNDRVLLCTNGLTDVVSGERIADVLAARHEPAYECQALVEHALEAGAPDNVTVLIADYRVPAEPNARLAAGH